MKVAFINQPWDNVIPPVQGGSLAIWTYQVAQRILSSHTIIIYSRRSPGQPAQEWHNEILYRHIPTELEDEIIKAPKFLERLLKYPRPKHPFFSTSAFYYGYIKQIARDLTSHQCDIVHIHNFSQFAPIIRRHNPHTKIVLHMQCDWLAQLDEKLIRKRLETVDLVIGCSDHVTDGVRQRFPKHAHKCHTVYNGADFSNSNNEIEAISSMTSPDQPRLLFVGRVSPEKGVHDLLDAIPLLYERYPNFQVDIVGHISSAPYEYMVLISDDENVQRLDKFYDSFLHRGNYEADLRQRIPSHLANQVHLRGQIPHSQTNQYYHQCTMLVNPSLTEAFGMTLVEAMSCQKPVIATNIGGMKEIVEDGKTGRLVPPGNPEQLAQAIIELINNPERCQSMGLQGQERVHQLFSWDKVAQSLLNLYENLK